MKAAEKFVMCIRCGHAVSWFEHTQLRVSVDCQCGAKDQFGPGVYVPDFGGDTLDYVLRSRKQKTATQHPGEQG
jgi:hypothetical protein